MRHFILRRTILAGPVAARPFRMFDPAATGRLIASPRLAQRAAARRHNRRSTHVPDRNRCR